MGVDINVSTAVATDTKPAKALKGFAAMTKEKQRAIASLGGKASHNPAPGRKKGHEWNTAAAIEAGRRGGLNSNGGRGRGAK